MHTQIRPRTLLTAVILLAAGAVVALGQESYTLEHKFEKGKTYRYAASAISSVTQEMGGQEMHVAMESWFVPSIVLENQMPDGNLVLIYSADSAKAHIKSPNMDSTMVMNRLIGKRTRLVITPKGDVVRREVIDTVKMDRLMSGLGLREMIRLPRLATGPVKMGDTWNVTQDDTTDFGGGKIVTTTNLLYTLAGNEKVLGHDCLKITYAGTATTAGKGTMMGMELFVEGSGKSAGTFFFDSGKGMFVRNEMKADNETTMAATGQQNMTIPISSTTEVTMSVKE
jgi:hypothetical protein